MADDYSPDFSGWEQWPHATAEAFDRISVHDTFVHGIERAPGMIRVFLDLPALLEQHPANPHGEPRYVSPAVLTFIGVTAEARRCDRGLDVAGHAQYADEIELDPEELADGASVETGQYQLYGFAYTEEVPGQPLEHYGLEWRISATGFELRWKELGGVPGWHKPQRRSVD